MKNNIEIIKDIPLFNGINKEDLHGMLDCLGATVRSYKKDDYIWLTGERIHLVGIVLSGEANILKEDMHGNRRILATVRAKGIFGESLAFSQTAESPVTVQAFSDAKVLFVDFRRIHSVCSNACVFHSRLIQNMLMLIAEKNMILNEKIDIIAMKTTRQKIAAYLLNQRVMQGKAKFRIPFNRSELADYLSVNRSALSRELGRMQDEGLITFHKNIFTVSDSLDFSAY